MTKAELEAKSLSELHALAAEAGVPRYRMLSRPELIERLGGGSGPGAGSGSESRSGSDSRSGSESRSGSSRSGSEQRERPQRQRQRRRRSAGGGDGERGGGGDRGRDRPKRTQPDRKPRPESPQRERAPGPEPTPPTPTPNPAAQSAPKPRRRRRFGRRRAEVSIQDLLLPPVAGRQAILCAPTREACTALLRGVAADLAKASKGPDPVVLLVDPSPEELADWKREAPDAEIVAAGQARHASDALAQASARAGGGEDVILLVDSLTRLGSAYGDAGSAKEFFDAGRVQSGTGGGSLTVVAALER